MSATALAARRGLAAPNDRRRSAPAEGASRAPNTQGVTAVPHSTFPKQLAAAEQARHAHLRRLWQMSAEQRVCAVRRGEPSPQLAAWAVRHPAQVARVTDEFDWIAALIPESCE
jgi:hypothetical protein